MSQSDTQQVAQHTISSPDPISADLERALFKRFWAWLGVVGSLMLVIASGSSFVALQIAPSLIEDKIQETTDKIDLLEKNAQDSIDRIRQKSTDVLISAEKDQTLTSEAAKSARETAATLQKKLDTFPQVIEALKNGDTMVSALAQNKDFIDRVAGVGAKKILAYKCPVGWQVDHGQVAWLSTGCQGQLSLEPACRNQSWSLNPGRGGIDEARTCELVGSLQIYARE